MAGICIFDRISRSGTHGPSGYPCNRVAKATSARSRALQGHEGRKEISDAGHRRTLPGTGYHRPMNTRYDVVIIGGGVTGCSTAVFLAREPGFDGKVLVVERDPTYENAPSAKATGGFRQQFSTPENIRIGLFGVHFLKHLDEYLSIDGETPDVSFRENGYLLLATESMLPAMLDSNAVQRELGGRCPLQGLGRAANVFPLARHRRRRWRVPERQQRGIRRSVLAPPGLPAQGTFARRRVRARRGALGAARGRTDHRRDACRRRRRRLWRRGQRGRRVRGAGDLCIA